MSFVKGFKKFSDGLDKLCIAVVVIMLAATERKSKLHLLGFPDLQWRRSAMQSECPGRSCLAAMKKLMPYWTVKWDRNCWVLWKVQT